jgi:hypothetical protein
MESNRIDLEYTLEEKYYISLFMHSPSVRSLRWLAFGGMLILIPIFYVVMSLVNISLFNKGQFEIWDSFTIVYISLLYIGGSFYVLSKLKSRARKQGKDNYEKLYSGRIFSITYDRKKSEFLVGKHQKRVPVNKDLRVFSTSDNYFFYKGKGSNGVIFLIPKNMSEQQDLKLQSILQDLTAKKGIEIRQMKIS